MRRLTLWTPFIEAAIWSITCVSLLAVVDAQVMSSPSYQLQSDSVNVSGGLSSSTAYRQESTVGEIATGRSSSASYNLRAGYQQLQEVFISLTPVDDVTMSNTIPGISGGSALGSTTVTVITDSPGGYLLTIAAANSPAMQNGPNTIPNYPINGTPDFTFTTPAASARFGFSPEGVDIPSAFKDNGIVCGIGTGDTPAACWSGIPTTTLTVATSHSANQPAGATTTLQFKLEVTAGAGVFAGEYTATTTLTALTL